jgi:hypothetical protein
MHIGDEAGGNAHQGYKTVQIDKQKHYLHRLIFLYHHGKFPETVDHIDNNTENNCIENLRAATFAENAQNSTIRKTNKLGVKNVIFDEKSKMYRVYVRAKNKCMFIGSYKDLDLAGLVAAESRNKYHGTFANHK